MLGGLVSVKGKHGSFNERYSENKSTVFLDVTRFSPIFLHTHVLVISLTSQVYEPTSCVSEYFETLIILCNVIILCTMLPCFETRRQTVYRIILEIG